MGRPGDEKVGAKGRIPTLPCRKWGTRASFFARTEAMAMSYSLRGFGTLFPILNTLAKARDYNNNNKKFHVYASRLPLLAD